jgi:hypothetical protein
MLLVVVRQFLRMLLDPADIVVAVVVDRSWRRRSADSKELNELQVSVSDSFAQKEGSCRLYSSVHDGGKLIRVFIDKKVVANSRI